MKNKDLIKDILTYLKDNEEARDRFNASCGFKDNIRINYLYTIYDIRDECDDETFEHLIIHALSSPNGKPICGFLEGSKFIDEAGYFDEETAKWINQSYIEGKINYAKTLRTIYLEALDEGKSHDEAYKLINDKYNKL